MIQNTTYRVIIFLTLTIAVILACAPVIAPVPTPIPTFDVNSINAIIAGTANAAFTQTAFALLPPTSTAPAFMPTPITSPNSINTLIVQTANAASAQTAAVLPATITPVPNWNLGNPFLVTRAVYTNGLAPEYHYILDALPYASLYSINFVITDDMYQATGNETIVYTNTESIALNKIDIHLFPNILGGEMLVSNIKVNKESSLPKYSMNDSLLTIPLIKSLQPYESVTLSMDFTITVSQSPLINSGVQTYFDNVLTLAHAYPMIAVYDDKGWNAEIPPDYGDITYADASFFIVTVEAPKEVVLASSGREINHKENGNRQNITYAAGPARDFFLAASPEYKIFTKDFNGITLRLYTKDSRQDKANYVFDIAADSMKVFNQRYALYPYLKLDIIATPTRAGGVEYPGAIVIAEKMMESDSPYLETVVAHETGHQWFYSLVGNDQLDEPWLDESLTQFATLQYFTDKYGQAETFHKDLEKRWANIDNKEIPVGLPVRNYTEAEYADIIYGRGGLFFEALQNEMGWKNFDAFIKDYVQSNIWGITTTEKLKAKAEAHCACDLTPLFQNWIYP